MYRLRTISIQIAQPMEEIVVQDCVILLPWSPQVVWSEQASVCLQVVQQLAAEMFPQAAPPQTMSLADAHQAAEVETCYSACLSTAALHNTMLYVAAMLELG